MALANKLARIIWAILAHDRGEARLGQSEQPSFALAYRIPHTAYRLDLKGESMRTLMAPKHHEEAIVPLDRTEVKGDTTNGSTPIAFTINRNRRSNSLEYAPLARECGYGGLLARADRI